jgi:chemotaxis protein MotB
LSHEQKKHPEHVNHERWLVSYADFITLLFAFFVVLFASSQSDKKKQLKLSEAMQTAFNASAITNSIPSPIVRPLPSASTESPTETLEETEARLRKLIAQQVAAGGIPLAASPCASLPTASSSPFTKPASFPPVPQRSAQRRFP